MENQSIAQKLEALVKLQAIDSKIDELKKLRGDLPDEVQDLEDEIEGYKTRLQRHETEQKDLEENIAAKDVLLVEDIVDTGFTVRYLMRALLSRNPRSLEICALLDRRARRIIDLDLKYVGFEIPDKFIETILRGGKPVSRKL